MYNNLPLAQASLVTTVTATIKKPAFSQKIPAFSSYWLTITARQTLPLLFRYPLNSWASELTIKLAQGFC
jgi:hypothetical protein